MSIFNRHGPYECVAPFSGLSEAKKMALIFNGFGRIGVQEVHTTLKETSQGFYERISDAIRPHMPRLNLAYYSRLIVIERVPLTVIESELMGDPSFAQQFPSLADYHGWWASEFGLIESLPEEPWPLVLADPASVVANPYEKFADCYDRLHAYIASGRQTIPCLRLLE
jgi:hypothetical protein